MNQEPAGAALRAARPVRGPARRAATWLASLGAFCQRHALIVVILWAALLALAVPGAMHLHERLFSGSGEIEGSASQRIDRLLLEQFPDNASPSLVLALRSPSLERNPEALDALLFDLKLRLFEESSVENIYIESDVDDARLRPAPGTGHVVLVKLLSDGVESAEQAVPRLRAAVAPVLEEARAAHPDLEWAMTGQPALTVDLNHLIAEDTARAELLAIPLTLIILVLAFRSLTAAALPLILALVGTTVTLGLLALIAEVAVVSNLVQSVASMIGLALGIDYSLFLVHAYRRAAARHACAEAEDPKAAGRAALGEAMSSAGTAIFYSGLAVMVGMAGLLATPLMQTRSIGAAGVIVVGVTLAAALTLLPALLALIGPRRLEWPRLVSGRLDGRAARIRWTRWAKVVTNRPKTAALASLAALLVLAAPSLETRFGLPEGEFLPRDMEYARGMDMLESMHLKGLLAPVPVILSDTQGGRALTRERVDALIAFSERLRQDRRVDYVRGPVDLGDAWPAQRYRTLYRDVDEAMAEMPVLRTQFVSSDETRMLFWVVPNANCTLEDVRSLTLQIPAMARIAGLHAEAGGQAQYYNDFETEVFSAYAPTFGFVLIGSIFVLLLAFRAPLVAAKAMVLNALSVLAGYGVVVWIFQLGNGAEWLGLATATEVVPITVPLMIFCILFGLSMDYEVFLLSRAKAAYERSGDNKASISEALTDTGTIITSAALVMMIVFGAFGLSRVVLVQMIGIGLAVSVWVDATLIRSMLGPALMQLAGRWNWWPATGRMSGLANPAAPAFPAA